MTSSQAYALSAQLSKSINPLNTTKDILSKTKNSIDVTGELETIYGCIEKKKESVDKIISDVQLGIRNINIYAHELWLEEEAKRKAAEEARKIAKGKKKKEK